MLACAGFREEATAESVTHGPAGTLEGATGRDGVLQLRASGGAAAFSFQAWFTSLALWRDDPAGRITPETDGLVGGRWRGTLAPTGSARVDVRPFMPPSVLLAADLSDLFDDFFPPLPDSSIAPGGRTERAGIEFSREPDSTGAEGPLARYRWREDYYQTADDGERGEQVREEGWMAWHPERGPLAWRRVVQVVTVVQRAGSPPVESRVEQVITVVRVPADC